jgi:diguanylate cyclase (GGDEF)-like protein
MEDVRYSELLFLRELAAGSSKFERFWGFAGEQTKAVGLDQHMYVEMACVLLEDLYVRFDEDSLQLMVAQLRRELSPNHKRPHGVHDYQWENPRAALRELLTSPSARSLRITFRGLRRISELQDLLLRDRILEPFAILISMQFFRRDLEESLRRGADVPVSVIYADMDKFKPINDKFGMDAGDVVMRGYLTAVRDVLGVFGHGYRGVGDEVVGLVVGQGHERATEFADQILERIRGMKLEHNGKPLPPVTASIGVATTPPESRGLDLQTIAEGRKRQAKSAGKNRVIAG